MFSSRPPYSTTRRASIFVLAFFLGSVVSATAWAHSTGITSFSINKTTVAPNETVTLSGTVTGSHYGHSYYGYARIFPAASATGTAVWSRRYWYPDGSNRTYNFSTQETAASTVGTHYFTLRQCVVNDSTCTTRTISYTVERPNRAPVLSNPGNQTVDEGKRLSFTISASDPDGDNLTWTITGVPLGASVSGTGNSRTFTWTPNYTQSGTYNVTFRVTDDGKPSKSTSRTVQITVRNINRSPRITSSAPTSATENSLYTYSPTFSDPDSGDTHTWRLLQKPSGALINATTGRVTWTPGDAAAGKSYDFQISVCDQANACDSQSWKVTVSNVNDPPQITTFPSTNVIENQLYSYSPAVRDPDPGDAHTWTLVKGPGSASIVATSGRLTWTPGNADAGKTFDFEIKVCDKANACDSQSWKVTVTNVNDPPKIVGTPGTSATEDVRYSYSPRVTDPDPGDSHIWLLLLGPNGASVHRTTGLLTWTPGDTDAGRSFSFRLQVCDRLYACATQNWKVTVANVNDPPQIEGNPPLAATEDLLYLYSPTVKDPDPGDAHTWKMTTHPGGATMAADGQISWTPGDADVGKEVTFAIQVCDKAGQCDTQTWKVKVANVNDPPVITSTPPTAAVEKKLYTYSPTVKDPDPGEAHTWKMTNAPSGATMATNGKISWTPGAFAAGKTFSFAIQVCDKASKCDIQTWQVKVTNVNDPPKIVGTPSTSATEDQIYSYAPKVTDLDAGETHTWSLKKGPSAANVDASTGKLTWTPGDADVAKTFDFEIEVCDKANACDSQSWKVTVANVNDPPAITSTPPTSASEDSPYVYTVQVNDPDPGDAQSWKLNKKPTGATIDKSTGKITWTPGDAAAGKEFDFEVEVCDKAGMCDSKCWMVKVTNVNDAPKITSTPPTSATEDKEYTYEAKASDPDPGDALTWALNKGPTGATIDKSTGKVTWTPADADAGKEFDFEVEVCDKAGKCDSQSWKVKVTNVNDPPVISSTPPTSATEDKEYTYEAKADDPDPGETLTWSLKQKPTGATIDKSTGKITWTPGDADAGKEFDFEVEVCDKAGKCDSESWKVKVTNVNDAPKITSTPPTSATEDKEYAYQAKASDPDRGDSLTWALNKGPTSVTIDKSTGKITWTPADADAGKSFDFEVEVCDKAGKCDSQSWKVTVTNVNDSPAITSTPPAKAYVGEDLAYEAKASDADPGDSHQWELTSGPTGATIDKSTGKVSWTPAATDAGKEFDFKIKVCDDASPPACVSQTFKVKVYQRCKVDANCPSAQICVQGLCLDPGCAAKTPHCSNKDDFCLEGKCVPNRCAAQSCTSGEICRPSDGKCIKPCAGVLCPPDKKCKDGACVDDPCAVTPCQKDEICDTSDPVNPTCVKNPCTSGSCKHGRVCSAGLCIDDPCPQMKCPGADQRCVAGQCLERQKCTVDVDCPGDEVCLNDKCYAPGCYLQKAACTSPQLCLQAACVPDPCASKQCASGEFCRRNDDKCVKPCAGVSCGKGKKCVDGACVEDLCLGQKCSPGETCIAGSCQLMRCNRPNVCKHGRLCDITTNRCVDDPCANVTCPDPKQVCQWGQCNPPPSCYVDKDCPGDALCLKGQCVIPQCTQNSACQSTEICFEGRCKPNPCQGVSCGADQFCRLGQCVDSCAGIFCKEGQHCLDGVCVSDPCHQVNCPAGEVCSNGRCQKDRCAPDSCKNNRSCKVNRCEPDPCLTVQCPSGQSCKEGQCTGDLPCTSDSDCPGLAVCIEKTCQGAGCYQSGCAKGQLCLKGKCIDNPCAKKQCAPGEFCRPSDDRCLPVCPNRCPSGERCQEGSCKVDPCDGVACAKEESCDEGKCVKDPCKTAPGSLCKFQRLCHKGQCQDDPCLGLQCASGQICRDGLCYGPAPQPEVLPEPAVEAAPEAAPEATAEPPAEPTIKDGGDNKEGKQPPVEKAISGGGCGCSSSHSSSTSGLLVLLLLLLAAVPLRRRR